MQRPDVRNTMEAIKTHAFIYKKGNGNLLIKLNMTEYILLLVCVRDMTIGCSIGLSSKACLAAADVIYGCFPIPSFAKRLF